MNKILFLSSNTNWHHQNSSLSSTNVTSQSDGLYRCDAVNKAGASHIVYRVNIVAGPKVKDIVAFSNGEGVTVDGALEVMVSVIEWINFVAAPKVKDTVKGVTVHVSEKMEPKHGILGFRTKD